MAIANPDLYTPTASAKLRAVVPLIKAQYGDEFRTDRFRRADGTRLWCKAFCDEKTNLWTVERYESTPSALERKKTRYQNLCFFDALQACAWFEVSAKGIGDKPETEALPDTYYKIFASREGIPFDQKTHFPAPAAEGRILVDGLFESGAEQRAAERTKGNLMAVLPDSGTTDVTNLPVPVRQKTKAQQQQEELIEALALLPLSKPALPVRIEKTGVENSLTRLSDSFDNSVQKRFTELPAKLHTAVCLSGVLAGSLIVGGSIIAKVTLIGPFTSEIAAAPAALALLASAIGTFVGVAGASGYGIDSLVAGDFKKLPRRSFHKAMVAFHDQANALPAGPFKEEMKKAARNADLGFHMLWLRTASCDVEEKNNYFRRRRQHKALKAFNKAASHYGLTPDAANAQVKRITEDPGNKEYDEEIEFEVQARLWELSEYVEKLRDAGPETFKAVMGAPKALPEPA